MLNLQDTEKRLKLCQLLMILLVGLGIVFRLVQYLYNRSLWLDEAALALNIIDRPFAGLLASLDYDQAAPLGYLVIEKAMVLLLGDSEYSLRLFPLIAGVVSVLLFYWVARQHLDLLAALIAVGLFATSRELIYYSAEVKQYGSDVLVALALLLAASRAQSGGLTFGNLVVLAVAGAAAVWLSYPALFVLAGISLTFMVIAVASRDLRKLGKLSILLVVWGLSFVAYYLVSLRHLANNSYILSFWQDHFMPLPPRSFGDLKWFFSHFFDLFSETAGLRFTGLAALTAIVGGYVLYRGKREFFLLLTLPVVVCLVASGFHKYPFSGRLLLFLTPALLLLVGAGAADITVAIKSQHSYIGVTLLLLLFSYPASNAFYHLVKPITREDFRSVLANVLTKKKKGDKIYIHSYLTWQLKYYQKRYPLNEADYILGIEPRVSPIVGRSWTADERDLSRLRDYQRVWVIIYEFRKEFFLHYLDQFGKRQDAIKDRDLVVSAYLYEIISPASIR